MSPLTRSYVLILALFCTFYSLGTSQTVECSYDKHYRSAQEADPQFRQSTHNYEQAYQTYIKEENKNVGNEAFQNLPIVIHVVHGGDSLGSMSNPRDEVILDAIEYANDIFRQTNTEETFQNPYYGADTEISFCLASRDEEGMPAPGIVRHYKQAETTFFFNNIYWDKQKYINVVITEVADACGAYFPGGDIIWISNNCYIDFVALAHELGHYLTLKHTFLIEEDCSNEDCYTTGDFVCDTPPQKNSALIAQDGFEGQACEYPGSSCQSDEEDTSEANPYRAISLGGLGDQPDAHSNVMGYGGSCSTNFTQGQTARMQFNLTEYRNELWSQPSHCGQPFVSAHDVGIDRIQVRSIEDCQQSISIDFDILNHGISIVNNVKILLFQNNQLIDSLQWLGELGSGEKQEIAFDNVSSLLGENIFEVRNIDSNFKADDNSGNDSNFIKYSSFGISKNIIGLGESVQCDNDAIQIGIEIIGSEENYQYLWRRKHGFIEESQQGKPIINISVSDEYYLNIYSEDYSCEWMETISVGQKDNVFENLELLSVDGDITCSTHAILLSSNYEAGIHVEWYDRSGLVSTDFSSTHSVDSAGDYRFKAIDIGTGCETFSAWYTVKDLRVFPEVYLELGEQITCTNQEVIIDASNSIFEPEQYTYIWKDLRQGERVISGETGQYLTVDEPGRYGLEIVDNLTLCTSQKEIEVLSDAAVPLVSSVLPIQIDFTNEDTVRVSATVSNATSDFNYHWTTDQGEILEGEYTLEPLVIGYAQYTLEVEDTFTGCVQRRIVNLIPSHSIFLNTEYINFFCQWGFNSFDNVFVRIDIEGNFGFPINAKWYNPNGIVEYSNYIIDTEPGIYIAEYFNGLEIIVDSFLITEAMVKKPKAVIDPVDAISCSTEEFELSGANSEYCEGAIFTWTDENNKIIGNNISATGVGGGLYTLKVRSQYNTCNSTDWERVDLTDPLAFAYGGLDAYLKCGVDSVTLGLDISNDNLEFKWHLIENMDTIFIENASTISVGEAGSYLLEVENVTEDCYTFDEVQVFDLRGDIDVQIGSVNSMDTCVSYQTLLSIENVENHFNYLYKWTFPNGEQGDKFIFPATDNGAYVLDYRALDSQCEKLDTFYYTAVENLELNYSIEDKSCEDNKNGAIILSPIGGFPPYQLENDQYEYNDLPSGLYQFEVTDLLGCKVSTEILLMDPTPLMITGFTNAENGLAVNYEGGVQPYSIVWNTDQEGETINNLEFGSIYAVTITDGNGCVVDDVVQYEPHQTEDLISVVPNPASGEIQVYTQGISFVGTLKIYNAAGVCVKNKENYRSLDKLELSYLPSGVYFVELSNAQNRLVTRFVVAN